MKSDNESNHIALIFFSIQRALIGEITTEIRAISVEYSPEVVRIWVYVDGEISTELRDDFDSSVMGEILSDFPYPEKDDPSFELHLTRCDLPKQLSAKGKLIFGRKGEF
jgi:hypothetical protein